MQHPSAPRPLLSFLFFVSGFCGLLYQVVWTRIAFASFGIIMPVLSVVISVFMLGLSLGSWLGGRWINALVQKAGFSAIHFYALTELIIGFSAFVVPAFFQLGERVLLGSGQIDSSLYLLLSALVLAFSILPWCIFMGATFPLMMAYIREHQSTEATSFSYLYLANVLGAMSGTLLTALVLVELLGFRHTLLVAASGNFLIAAISLWLGWNSAGRRDSAAIQPIAASSESPRSLQPLPGSLTRWILFSTGFVSMAMEVVWIRAFAPVLKTQVYSFALVLATYLGATFAGSLVYRRQLRARSQLSVAQLVAWLCIFAFLPILANDPRLVRANWQWHADPASVTIILISICPFCAILGYLTPKLIDDYASGSPKTAGKAYALNVLGCILGPLFASYILLPRLSDRFGLILLALPLLLIFVRLWKTLPTKPRFGFAALVCASFIFATFFSGDYEDHIRHTENHTNVRRDYTASVISFGEGREKHLLVNGIGMTSLTPITKFMVHLPLAFHQQRPQSALIICFGMGTTFRSALSWGVDTTAVELVPSVKDAFVFYHDDASTCLDDPKGRIIIDDGRRYLKRITNRFDVIVVDPPPPLEAAGSSLLYSEEFYELAKQHLKPNGILQAWVPGGDLAVSQAAFRSVRNCFPYMRGFTSVQRWGTHLLASMDPIPERAAPEIVAAMPAKAAQDLLEWADTHDLNAYLGRVLSQEKHLEHALNPDPNIRITDDSPYNEYFFLRQLHLF